MASPQQHFDWHTLVDEEPVEAVVDTRRRLRWILAMFAGALAVIFARAVQLEISDGENFRQLAAQPLERSITVPARRGRILARDGTPLAADNEVQALAVQYRYLENPPDAQWLRQQARRRLSRAERRDPQRIAAMEDTLRGELAQLQARLARLCQLSDRQWQSRTLRIARNVARQAEHVNRRRLDRFYEQQESEVASDEPCLTSMLFDLFAPPEQLPPPPVLLAEQVGYHRVVNDLSSEVIAQIERDPKSFPGVKVVRYTRRTYPLGLAAANVIGHLGSPSGSDFMIWPVESASGDAPVGQMGIEHFYEPVLRPQAGTATQLTDHRGELLSTIERRGPVAGRDVVLTLDAALQISAEALLDGALRRLSRHSEQRQTTEHGGAIIVLDVRSGELLVAASGPRFDPNWFATGDPRAEATLTNSGRPLFDRVAKMAIPPGSVFKPLVAAGLVERGAVDPREVFDCQGYLEDPARMRCQIFRHHGIGHGEVDLAGALAQSCNVYFFHHAEQLGAAGLLDWAMRFGFGRTTGLGMNDEAAGSLPSAEQLRQPRQAQAFAIGQGALTVTPLQIARMYAALANGGRLIVPRLTRARPDAQKGGKEDRSLAPMSVGPTIGLSDKSLEAVHEGLRTVVEDPNGTAYETVRMPTLAVAGKTGTAETGGAAGDHAWFAGYAPADAPRYAFVVVLEHAGSGSAVAGSLAKNLLERMQQLGYFPAPAITERPIPAGKG